MSTHQLHLEDCLDDTPQTRALIGVYEKDADALLDLVQDLNGAYQHIVYAQNELTLATQALSNKLKSFQSKRFTLDSESDIIGGTIQQLTDKIDEVCSYHMVMFAHMKENMEFQSKQFFQEDISEYRRLKSSFYSSDKSHEEASAKLARVSKKKTNEKNWQEATDQLYAVRKAFHNTSMLYCSCLNSIQRNKKVAILKPAISYLQAQSCFNMSNSDVCKPETKTFLEQLSTDMQELQLKNSRDKELCVEAIDRLDAASTRAYIPDPPASLDFPDLPVDRSKTQINGYLFCRSRSGLLTHWNRHFFFTQGGNLMQQNKDELAGQLTMDLDGCAVMPVDSDDRRHVFQIASSSGRRVVVLQAESKHKYEEWLSTLQNIAAGLYLHDDPKQAILDAQSQQAAAVPPADVSSPTPDSVSGSLEQLATRRPGSVLSVDGPRERRSGSTPSDGSSRPSIFERFKQAATNLLDLDLEESTRASSPVPVGPAMAPQDASGGQPAEPPSTPQPPPSENDADAVLDSLVKENRNILFDLPVKVPENNAASVGAQQNNTSTEGDESVTDPSAEAPPNVSPDLAFKTMFVVRFLGCKPIAQDSNPDLAISETIWQVMTARALNQVFRMNELHLIVTEKGIELLDAETKAVQESFEAASILRSLTHSENRHLFGFVAHHASVDQLMCYTFEGNADGNEICCAINTSKVMDESKKEHEETVKQQEMVSELEEQSKLTTAVAEDLYIDDELN